MAQEHRVAFVEEKNTKSEEVKMGDKLSKQKTKQQKESDMRQAMASNTAPSNQLLHGRGKVSLYFIADLIKKWDWKILTKILNFGWSWIGNVMQRLMFREDKVTPTLTWN